MENRFRHKDGGYRWIYWTMTAEQGLIYVIGRNVTADKEAAQAHRQTEEQLRQLQKMESVGQLTGGIAHDFNNLLTIIIGNLEILGRTLSTLPARATRSIAAAMSGATRAATLTQRLLAYAQRQPLRPRAVDLNELATGMAELISRTQGETIHYEFALATNLPLCFCDANQLETALLNLVINARDAMPEGGRLKIETANVAFDADAAHVAALPRALTWCLPVSDTGSGMSRETAERAFEPFFTTKGPGKGTGLGLSMVYGFVKQSNGHVEIESEPGRGTTVRIFLPLMAASEASEVSRGPKARRCEAPHAGQRETILVAEDDAGVRGYVAETLRELNYRVMEAERCRRRAGCHRARRCADRPAAHRRRDAGDERPRAGQSSKDVDAEHPGPVHDGIFAGCVRASGPARSRHRVDREAVSQRKSGSPGAYDARRRDPCNLSVVPLHHGKLPRTPWAGAEQPTFAVLGNARGGDVSVQRSRAAASQKRGDPPRGGQEGAISSRLNLLSILNCRDHQDCPHQTILARDRHYGFG